jgi:hypothetical protein
MARKRYEACLVYDTQEKSKNEMVWRVYDKSTKGWWNNRGNRPTYFMDADRTANWLNGEEK